MKLALRAPAKTTVPRGKTAAPEQACEEVAELLGTGRLATVKLETLIPVRWRPEILAGLPVGAQLVVGGALFRIFEHLIGFSHLLESFFGIRLLADVRVVLSGQFAVGAGTFMFCRVLHHCFVCASAKTDISSWYKLKMRT